MKTSTFLKVISLIAALATITGCHWRPNLGVPGDKDYQRSRAVIYDPFPDANAGPTIEGGRPLGYQRPITDTSRSQMTTHRRPPGSGF